QQFIQDDVVLDDGQLPVIWPVAVNMGQDILPAQVLHVLLVDLGEGLLLLFQYLGRLFAKLVTAGIGINKNEEQEGGNEPRQHHHETPDVGEEGEDRARRPAAQHPAGSRATTRAGEGVLDVDEEEIDEREEVQRVLIEKNVVLVRHV